MFIFWMLLFAEIWIDHKESNTISILVFWKNWFHERVTAVFEPPNLRSSSEFKNWYLQLGLNHVQLDLEASRPVVVIDFH